MESAISLGLFILLLVLFISMNLGNNSIIPLMPRISGFTSVPLGYEQQPIISRGAMQCGVDMPSCPEGTKCMNGFCMGLDVPVMKGKGLRVVP